MVNLMKHITQIKNMNNMKNIDRIKRLWKEIRKISDEISKRGDGKNGGWMFNFKTSDNMIFNLKMSDDLGRVDVWNPVTSTFCNTAKFIIKMDGGWKFRFWREHYAMYIYVWNPRMFKLSDRAIFIIEMDGVLKVHDDGDYATGIKEIEAILNEWLSEGEELKL